MLKNVLTGARAHGEQRGHRDVLEPRRGPVGAGPGGALPAPARAGHGAGARARRTTTRTTCRPRPPAGWPRAMSASSCASSGTSDEKSTPIEDTAVEWKERVSPPEPVAVLTLARGDLSTADALAQAQIIDAMAFNPWNTTDEFRPLGNLNRARKAVYDASSAHRLGYRWQTQPPLRNVVIGAGGRARSSRSSTGTCRGTGSRCASACSTSRPSGTSCAARNLLDSEVREAPPAARPVPPAPPGEDVAGDAGRSTGPATTCPRPAMGAVGSAFGRNLRPDFRPDLFDEPNPVAGQPAAAVPRALPARRGR